MQELLKKREQLQINRSKIVVINTLLEMGGMSRPDLMKATGLSQTSIHEVTKDLVDRGILLESSIGESSGGRKPVLLEVKNAAGFAIGIKIDKSGITTALVDLSGAIVRIGKENLPSKGEEEIVISQIVSSIKAIINEKTGGEVLSALLGIGVGVAGIVNASTGVLLESPILKWKNIRLKKFLQKEFQVPVFVDHDVNVLLSAESRYGRWKNEKNILCVMVGNGIGGGIILDSHVYRGSNGASAEFGHMVIDPTGPLCRCGKQGCLTTLASDEFFIREAELLLKEGKAPLLSKEMEKQSLAEPTVAILLDQCKKGDGEIKELYKDWIRYLALGIDNLIRIFDPQIILLGRESLPTEEGLIPEVTEEIKRINKLSLYSNVKLVPFSLQKDGWNIGAADLVFQKVLRDPLTV